MACGLRTSACRPSRAAGLSQVNAISIHKQLFIERPNLFRAMEQFNSAALEVEGPLSSDGKFGYRVFAAGGSGRFDGNVGGRNLAGGENYPWGMGAAFQLNAIGYYNRQDTPFLYVPVPLTLGIVAGAKYDEREQERYLSVNAHIALRYNRFILLLEDYFKREFEFVSDTNAFVAQAGVLVVPKILMVAAQFGQSNPGEIEKTPPGGSLAIKAADEQLLQGAAHFYVYRNIGVLSAIYTRRTAPEAEDDAQFLDHSFRLVGQYRF